ncbi:MAG: glycosyltransferase [Bacteroidia bacterium]
MESWLPSLIAILAFVHVGARYWLWVGAKKAWKDEQNRSTRFSQKQRQQLPPLSVVIAARNEEANLAQHLPSILQQLYPEFEIVIALDRCSDESEQVLTTFAEYYPNLRWFVIDETPTGWAPKKWALSQAIATAKYPSLVCTDADCSVESNWLIQHGLAFGTGNQLVVGLGMYTQYPGMLNRFIRYETAYTALQYVGAAGQGKAYMGVGRNMGYHRSLYDEAGGFTHFRTQLSGDDDLLVNHSKSASQCAVIISVGSRTWSEPKRTIRSWMRQKGRHFSASARYTAKSKIVLTAFHASQIGLYGLLALFLLAGGQILTGVGLYLGYLLGSWYIFSLFAIRIGQADLIKAFPILDFLYACYHSLIAPLGLLAQPSWQKNQNPKYQKTPSRTVSS